MFPIIFVLILLVPIAELYVIVQVGQEIGILPTIALLIGMSIAGAWLLKREGMATWRRFQESMRRGQIPAKEATDGALILFGGALLMTPGFLTDIVGILLVLPPTRAVVKGMFGRFAKGVVVTRMGPAGYAGRRVYEARVVKPRNAARQPSTPAPPPIELPPETPPSRPDVEGS